MTTIYYKKRPFKNYSFQELDDTCISKAKTKKFPVYSSVNNLTLEKLAGAALNRLEMPPAWSWTPDQVAAWMESYLQLPFCAKIMDGIRGLFDYGKDRYPFLSCVPMFDVKRTFYWEAVKHDRYRDVMRSLVGDRMREDEPLRLSEYLYRDTLQRFRLSKHCGTLQDGTDNKLPFIIPRRLGNTAARKFILANDVTMPSMPTKMDPMLYQILFRGPILKW